MFAEKLESTMKRTRKAVRWNRPTEVALAVGGLEDWKFAQRETS